MKQSKHQYINGLIKSHKKTIKPVLFISILLMSWVLFDYYFQILPLTPSQENYLYFSVLLMLFLLLSITTKKQLISKKLDCANCGFVPIGLDKSLRQINANECLKCQTSLFALDKESGVADDKQRFNEIEFVLSRFNLFMVSSVFIGMVLSVLLSIYTGVENSLVLIVLLMFFPPFLYLRIASSRKLICCQNCNRTHKDYYSLSLSKHSKYCTYCDHPFSKIRN